ncbi:MAG: methylmalonyl-CoA epimerase [Candidatus Dormibacteria bacterium]
MTDGAMDDFRHHSMMDTPFQIIDHIAVAVSGIDEAGSMWAERCGVDLASREHVVPQSVEVGFVQCLNARIELVAPASDATPISRFLASRGPGLHHIAFLVSDIDAALAWCRSHDLRLLDEQARLGAEGRRVAFLHPSAFHGVLVELCEDQQ